MWPFKRVKQFEWFNILKEEQNKQGLTQSRVQAKDDISCAKDHMPTKISLKMRGNMASMCESTKNEQENDTTQ